MYALGGRRCVVGRYIEVKERQWIPVVEAVVEKLISAFLVHDDHDRTIMQAILRKYNARDVEVTSPSPPSSAPTLSLAIITLRY
jgi:hypothetical protein